MGKSTTTDHLTAAKQIIKNAVFCVDNVDPGNDVDDVRAFVSGLSVNVLSCFTTVPRRRRNESLPIVDRKAFRLCIADADRERVQDDSKWPDLVTISEWYFIPSSDDRRQRAVVDGQRTERLLPSEWMIQLHSRESPPHLKVVQRPRFGKTWQLLLSTS